MNDDRHEPSDSQLLIVTSPATGKCQADTRHRLERWLEAHDVAKSDIGDVVLASSEALSNVVRHAYGTHTATGPMSLTAKLAGSVLLVAVQDEGTWKEAGVDGPRDTPSTGGWGIPLMRSLSQSLTVEHDGRRGTNVTARYELASRDPRHN
jgi:anti-sigma regulatory factor (Ser/Thr protein kinase)